MRNVIGLLRGSDPSLKETFVILSAHYDHLGIGPANGSGDRIYNGANDDGSGTVSVIEIASALATLHPRPKRSLVFATFYGEEHGLVGSRHYVEHPVVPLEKTVVDINLEQVGRTDDSDGPRVSAATVTGFDYSDVASTLRRAGQAVGVDVLKHPKKSDSYFGASDNAAFARAGIPAHTISVAYMFPDYHGADDEWEKIDFVNMAKVDRMAALGVIMIADGPAPAWNKDNPRAAPYRKMRTVIASRASPTSSLKNGEKWRFSEGKKRHFSLLGAGVFQHKPLICNSLRRPDFLAPRAKKMAGAIFESGFWGTPGSRETEASAWRPRARANPLRRGTDSGPRRGLGCEPERGVFEPCRREQLPVALTESTAPDSGAGKPLDKKSKCPARQDVRTAPRAIFGSPQVDSPHVRPMHRP